MKNISFDNPLWLLLLIPLAVGILVPYFIAIRKENKGKSVITSLVLHALIVLLVGLSIAGTVVTTVMTETHVYVVADLSYSANKSLDDVDRYIAEIKENLPKNAKMGVICFGKDYVLHTPIGEELTSVREAKVDETATDIASALEYAATLFGNDVLKRVVVLTDGYETVRDDVSGMIAAVERMVAQDIAIDAVYLDSNLKENVKEVQLTGVEYTKATYLNHDTTADILVQSNIEANAVLSLICNGEKLTDRAITLTKGYNVVNLDLPTGVAGNYSYEVRVAVEGDETAENNQYAFTQTVSSEVKVLFVTSNKEDIDSAAKLFGANAKLDVRFLSSDPRELPKVQAAYQGHANITISPDPFNVPCNVETLCTYDEIVLSTLDIRDIKNVGAFIESLEIVVSQYGKSLMTVGDTKIQNKTDEMLEGLEDMLPVKFGNSAQDPKLYTIVIDTSRSMFQASRFSVAQQAAVHLLSLLNDNDDVIVVTFAGDIKVIQSATKAANRESIAKKINELKPEQGTSIGGGLAAAVQMMVHQEHDKKEVMLISDGMNYTAEIIKIEDQVMTPVQVAEYMNQNDIALSTMNPYNNQTVGLNTLKSLASAGGGHYYYIESEKALSELVFTDIADDVTESVINKESNVTIARPKDDTVEGVGYMPPVMGYVHSKAKASAKTVLTVEYEKSSGVKTQVPLYSYWNYGNGRVSSFTSMLSGEWVEKWQGLSGQGFLINMMTANTPEEKNDCPYIMNVEYDGVYANVEILPAVLNPYATVDVTVTRPDGTQVTERLNFDASRYFYRFEAPTLGRYAVSVTYTTPQSEAFTSHSDFHISYSPEYDMFANFDASTLHAAIRHRGTVGEGTIPDLSKHDARVSTYRLTFTVPFMIAAVVLYVLDIIIRKLKWNDIKGLFKKSAQGGTVFKSGN